METEIVKAKFLLYEPIITKREVIDNSPLQNGIKYEKLTVSLDFISSGNTTVFSDNEILIAIRKELNELIIN
jgi:hypothetical protein